MRIRAGVPGWAMTKDQDPGGVRQEWQDPLATTKGMSGGQAPGRASGRTHLPVASGSQLEGSRRWLHVLVTLCEGHARDGHGLLLDRPRMHAAGPGGTGRRMQIWRGTPAVWVAARLGHWVKALAGGEGNGPPKHRFGIYPHGRALS